MNFKKILLFFLIIIAAYTFAQEQTVKTKIYGYVGNDLFYNSRQNVEMVDGIIQLFPKPIEINAGTDKNAVA